MGGGVAERRAAPDRVADEDDGPRVDRREKAGEELGVTPRRRRDAIVLGPSLTGPVEREDATFVAEPRREAREVAGAVTDRVETDDGDAPG